MGSGQLAGSPSGAAQLPNSHSAQHTAPISVVQMPAVVSTVMARRYINLMATGTAGRGGM